ncbi:hypothetical protein [Agitococcus lubricus]|uniref:Yip1 domain-containing protein n=1 Tax=Agitococcus lubricus TaxID=1077255 RepID=A0A2T5J0R1_9GAMM|nr:hypothetical protein [Agitococcus lubricus]PTQ89971.1 hypothetical protein C8N29_1049 [Agitococcus lubricus]
MQPLLTLFWQVLSFRLGPEDVPYHRALLLLLLAINLTVTAGGQYLSHPNDASRAVLLPIIALSVECMVLALLLQFKQLTARFVQSITAIVGCDTLLTIASLPLLVLSVVLPAKSPLLAFLGLIEVVILGWSLGLRAFVYHRALNIGLLMANMLAIAIFLLVMTVTLYFFPELLPQSTAASRGT